MRATLCILIITTLTAACTTASSTGGGGGGGPVVTSTDSTGRGQPVEDVAVPPVDVPAAGPDVQPPDLSTTDVLAGPSCGDGKCAPPESSATCPLDCPMAPAHWCDQNCGKQAESQCYCDKECATYGDCCLADGSLAPAKDNDACAGSTCQLCSGSVPTCGNGKCDSGESAASCKADCAPPPTCGNGTCDPGEGAVSCAADCKCSAKDNFCDGDTLHKCDGTSGKLAVMPCNDSVCKGSGFDKYVGCGVGGDGVNLCLCSECGNGQCETDESAANCPQDCKCSAQDSKCSGNVLTYCDATSGKLGTKTCSDQDCKAGGWGPLIGCQKGASGAFACICKSTACGDGVCDGGESSTSCPADCAKCSANASCGATQICLASYCTTAEGQKYVFHFVSGKVAATDKDGKPWDASSGALALPDPYAVVLVNGAKVCATKSVADTTSPVWDYSCPAVVIPAGASVEVSILHDYWTKDDVSMDGSLWKNFVPILHAGGYDGPLYYKKASVQFSVTGVKQAHRPPAWLGRGLRRSRRWDQGLSCLRGHTNRGRSPKYLD